MTTCEQSLRLLIDTLCLGFSTGTIFLLRFSEYFFLVYFLLKKIVIHKITGADIKCCGELLDGIDAGLPFVILDIAYGPMYFSEVICYYRKGKQPEKWRKIR